MAEIKLPPIIRRANVCSLINSNAISPTINNSTIVRVKVITRTRAKKTICPKNLPESLFVEIRYETKIGVQEARQIPTLLNIPNKNGEAITSRNIIILFKYLPLFCSYT